MPLTTDRIDWSQPVSDHSFNAGALWWAPGGPLMHGPRLWELSGSGMQSDLSDGTMMSVRDTPGGLAAELGHVSTFNSGTRTGIINPLQIPTSGSLFGWVRKDGAWPSGGSTDFAMLMGYRTDASGTLLFDWFQNSTNATQTNWGWYNGTRGADADRRYKTVGWAPSTDVWYHMVLCWDTSTNCALYRDGVADSSLVPRTAATGSSWHATPHMRIGYNEYPGQLYASSASFRDIILYPDRVLTATDVAFLYDQSINDYPDLLRRASTATWYVAQGTTAYTLTADAASYTVTGSAATLKRNCPLTADAGVYTVTGSAATLLRTRIVGADAAAYVVTGTAATLLRSRLFPADASAYVVTGGAASLLRGYPLTASAASYTVTGTAANVLYGRAVSASVAAYVVTGSDAALTLSSQRSLSADAAAYVVSGTAASLLRGLLVPASAGSYVVTGTAASLLRGLLVPASAGSYAVSGSAVSFARMYVLTAQVASYAITAAAVTLVRIRLFSADAAAYVVTGTAASLLRGLLVPASAAAYTVTGTAASLVRGRHLTAGTRAYTLAGDEVSLIYSGDPDGGFGPHVSKIPLRG